MQYGVSIWLHASKPLRNLQLARACEIYGSQGRQQFCPFRVSLPSRPQSRVPIPMQSALPEAAFVGEVNPFHRRRFAEVPAG